MKFMILMVDGTLAGPAFITAVETVARVLSNRWVRQDFGNGLAAWTCNIGNPVNADGKRSICHDKPEKRLDSWLVADLSALNAVDPAVCLRQLANLLIQSAIALDELAPREVDVSPLLYDLLTVARSKKWLPKERPHVRCYYSDTALNSHAEGDEAFVVTCQEALEFWDGLADEPGSFMGLYDRNNVTLQFYWVDQDHVDIDVPQPDRHGAFGKPSTYWECMSEIIGYFHGNNPVDIPGLVFLAWPYDAEYES